MARLARLAGVSLIVAASVLSAQGRSIVGAWRLEPELSTPVPHPPEGERAPGQGPGGGQRRGPMPYGGRFGRPGMGGGGLSEADMRRIRVIMDRLSQPPASLTIVREGARVIVTGADGRSVTYTTDGRKEERLTGDGEFVSRSRFEGDTLVIEEDFGGGVKLTTRATPVLSGDHEQLEVTLKATGLPERQGPPGSERRPDEEGEARASRGPLDSATRIYERVQR